MGNKKAAVLPEPVTDLPSTSLPENIVGTANS